MAISLSKITLEKQGDSHRIDLSKRTTGGSKEIVINLTWSKDGGRKKGFWASLVSTTSDIDLDLGCFWELKERVASGVRELTNADINALAGKGTPPAEIVALVLKSRKKSALDALQFAHGQGGPRDKVTKQGCYTQRPWVWHTGDDRSGSTGEGENILVNPECIKELKRIIVYCSIYEGVARWAETNAVVTIKVPDNPDVVVEMGKQTDARKFCAIAEITFDDNGGMTVKKLVSFHIGHEDCDRTYGWGMQWQAGTK
jgi:tellurite resistance protein TerA